MPSCNGFTCWVEVDGEALDEHQVVIDQETRTAKCWIESKVDKHFMIYWDDNRKQSPTVGKVMVDGQWADSPILDPRNWDFPAVCGAACVDDRTEVPFRFAPIKFTDDEENGHVDENTLKNLGTIAVAIKPITVTGRGTLRLHQRNEMAPIFERNKKAGVHHVGFGPATQAAANETLIFSDLNPFDNSPLVTFEFQYRPRDILRALEVFEEPRQNHQEEDVSIKPEPDQEPDQEDDEEGQTAADVKEEKRLQGELTKLKGKRAKRRTKQKAEPSTSKRIKLEPE